MTTSCIVVDKSITVVLTVIKKKKNNSNTEITNDKIMIPLWSKLVPLLVAKCMAWKKDH